MSNEARPFLVYHGTAHTEHDYRFLADCCQTSPARPEETIQDAYDREFSLGRSFTFIQCGDHPTEPPMKWASIGEDEAITTLVPEDDCGQCPYFQLRITTLSRSAQNYHFHVFYWSPRLTSDHVSHMRMLISLRVVSLNFVHLVK